MISDCHTNICLVILDVFSALVSVVLAFSFFVSNHALFHVCRVGAPPVQKASNGGGFTVNKPAHQANAVAKQRTQTLDSLFANMKEQRMKVLSKPNNGPRRNGGGQQTVPWVRGRLHY